MKKDYDLSLFSKAMDILVSSSQLKFDPFRKDVFVSSTGIEGYGTIGDFNRLAGAMNFKGLRTKTGKYITGSYLKNMKTNLTKKYGEDFVEDIVDWELVSNQILPESDPVASYDGYSGSSFNYDRRHTELYF
jgi:hypothetical protein